MKTFTTEELGIKCPDCGGTNIGHAERMIVAMRVARWNEPDEIGDTHPADFEGEYIRIEGSEESVDYPYYCLDCKGELDAIDANIEDRERAMDEGNV